MKKLFAVVLAVFALNAFAADPAPAGGDAKADAKAAKKAKKADKAAAGDEKKDDGAAKKDAPAPK